MKEIVASRRMENGVAVFYEDHEGKKYESFNFSELIDLKINALDLLEHPGGYQVDPSTHQLVMKK